MKAVFKKVYLEPYHENLIMMDTEVIVEVEYYDRKILNKNTNEKLPSTLEGLLHLKVVDNGIQPEYLFVRGTLQGFFELQRHAEKYSDGLMGDQEDLVYYPEDIGGTS